jgi:hypothetical protein
MKKFALGRFIPATVKLVVEEHNVIAAVSSDTVGKMKNLINLKVYQEFKRPFAAKLQSSKKSYAILLLMISIVFTSCEPDMIDPQRSPSETSIVQSEKLLVSETNVLNLYPSSSAATSWELQQARAATARYRDINNAVKDEYADISVVTENMGHHYMKLSNVDETFD